MLEEEMHSVCRFLREGGADIDCEFRFAAHVEDLLQALSETRPQVVHFSGHGDQLGLVLSSSLGTRMRRVDAAELASAFEQFRDDVDLVVLSASFSLPQAEAIADAVGCAIGTNGSISDEASLTFCRSFYRGIAFGNSVQAAYDQALTALALEHRDERARAALLVRTDLNPRELVLLPPRVRRIEDTSSVSTSTLRPSSEQTNPSLLRSDSVVEKADTDGLRTLTSTIPNAVEGSADDWDDAVPIHTDAPATEDELQRRPFAEVIGARIDEVRAGQQPDGESAGAFMVHIHGPWGAGKTSVLNFLREFLQEEPAQRRWVVVDFNAWRHQRIRPPWWSLLNEVHAQAARQLSFGHSSWLRAQWLWWRFRADWFPAAIAFFLILVTVAFTVGAVDTLLSNAPQESSSSVSASDGTAKNVELALKILTALFAAGGAALAASRSLVFGSSSAAQAYVNLRSDPLSPIVRLFRKLVKAVRRPIAIFVDDLDRCDADYVVELLEGIQTLLRGAPVTYVVAADRKWICSSFEKRYADFGGAIGEPGRPLGYLFLDKIFQVSASVPRPSLEVREAYWTRLLHASGSDSRKALDASRRKAARIAEEKIGRARTQEELEQRIAETAADPASGLLEQQAIRAAAARRITAPDARQATEHRLQRFSGLLEPNPRSMKRLVNAFGLHQATHFLEGRRVAPDNLARWTILELRWPLLADYLAARPHAAADLIAGRPPADDRIDHGLASLFEEPAVLAVMQPDRTGGTGALDEASVRSIVGVPTAPAATTQMEV